MSVTYGFYNSVADPETGVGDRRYTAEQLSSIFDGIINDGIYEGFGTAFEVKASADKTYITVGTGRAWFNHTWTLNNTTLVIQGDDIPPAHDTLNRYDAVVIEVNSGESYRQNTIKIVEGTPSVKPQYPIMENSTTVHQYALAYILRKYNTSEISQSDITNNRGMSTCPFVTGIISVLAIDSLVAQWESQFKDWTDDRKNEFDIWEAGQKTDFTTWFNGIKGILGTDEAGNLLNLIQKHHHIQLVTFPADGWSNGVSPFTNTVTLTGATGAVDERPAIDISYEGRDDITGENSADYMLSYSSINYYKTGENTITAYCLESAPSMDVTVSVEGI